jgi:hypothetical protein
MRSNKELLQLLLDNRQYFYFGLCGLAGELRINYIITFEEYCKIKNYIKNMLILSYRGQALHIIGIRISGNLVKNG